MTNAQPNNPNVPLRRRTGFRDFAQLLHQIGETRETSAKVEWLAAYLKEAPPSDKAWTLGLFTGRRLRRMVGTRQLTAWLAEWEEMPEWLFEECYHQVGDLAETLALLDRSPAPQEGMEGDLADQMRMLSSLSSLEDEEKKRLVKACWSGMSAHEKFVFNKFITGGFRVGVSAQTVIQALAKATGLEASVVAHRLSGNWDPATTDVDALLQEGSAGQDLSRPYPFYLAYPLEAALESLGRPSEWHAEWKWDGIRGQVIRRGGQSFVWSRGEELITDRFPEFVTWMEGLPDGTVLDGEILAMRDGRPLPFSTLQTRIGRQKVSARQLREAPAGFMAFDLLEVGGQDWRERPFTARRVALKALVQAAAAGNFTLSEGLDITDWSCLATLRASARENGSEGLMLKRSNSTYQTGRRRGDWWKWKVDPMSVDAVLVYAQKGHGRRSNLYTDYTFAVRDGERLVVFAKAYSGLTDAEISTVDTFVKRHSLEKFGPVRTVTPELVFEIGFEGISESKRHKSGVAVRFPRILRWRTDKKPADIDTLDSLQALLRRTQV
ncbi:MAG: ATP-dependent DNA ligase [Bacteroidetes bacterium]|nr:ATP-dependent DNA ligase [Bacteroidota bacterium]